MQFTALSDSGLQVTAEEVGKVFEPFVSRSVTADDPDWRAETERRQRKIFRKYMRRLLLGWLPANRRNEKTVLNEYSRAWQKSQYASYSLDAPLPRISLWEWQGQPMFASDVGATRVRQLLLARFVERLRPKSVLEVGCGNGVNLMLLACRFPEIKFTGVELTPEGYRAATGFQELETLPKSMRDYAPLPLADPASFREVRFVQGNATSLPFSEGAFDLVITVLALEQMEQVRHQALREISRVAGGHLLAIEPFRDVNDQGWARRNVIRRNYFRGRIGELKDYGLQPILAINEFPQEAYLKVCAVLAQKQG